MAGQCRNGTEPQGGVGSHESSGIVLAAWRVAKSSSRFVRTVRPSWPAPRSPGLRAPARSARCSPAGGLCKPKNGIALIASPIRAIKMPETIS